MNFCTPVFHPKCPARAPDRKPLLLVLIVACVLAAICGCAAEDVREEEQSSSKEQPKATASRYRPALDSIARARKIEESAELLEGSGAEGQEGDVLLENSLLTVVIGAADRVYPFTASGGHVLDAALPDGADRVRVMLPKLGPAARGMPVYEQVEISSEGGEDTAAEVKATGHWSLDKAVEVVTTYRLEPDSTALQITTQVKNTTSEPLSDFVMSDRVYHGRTSRYVQGYGLYPRGREGDTDWFSFFSGHQTWGLFSGDGEPVWAKHKPGWSDLVYRTVSVEPSQRRSYARNLVVVSGGPAVVARYAKSEEVAFDSRLRCTITDRETGEPIANAILDVRHADGGHVGCLVSGEDGKASTRLPAGSYLLSCWLPGRPPALPRVPIKLKQDAERGLTLELGRSGQVDVRVTKRSFRKSGEGRPTSRTSAARIAVEPGQELEEWPGFRAPFHVPFAGLAGLVGPSGRGRLSLPPVSSSTPGTYDLTSALGPLYDCISRRVEVASDGTAKAQFALEQVILPGDYVAVDFRQYTADSPGCSLERRESLLMNRCEGLDGVVRCRPWSRMEFGEEAGNAAPSFIEAAEVRSSRCGSFTVIPSNWELDRERTQFEARPAAGCSAAELFNFLRMRFPEAVIQANHPLRESDGYLNLTGFSESEEAPTSEFSPHFDALELLSGRDVLAARKGLEPWFKLLNEGKKVFITGGSGSRGLPVPEPGVARTYVHCPCEGDYPSPEELRKAIGGLRDRPNAFVTNGPFLRVTVDDKPIGSLQTVEGKATLHVQVMAPNWVGVERVQIYCNGRLWREIEVSERESVIRVDRKMELEPDSDCWLVVVAEGDEGMRPVYPGQGQDAVIPFAATNPLWLDTDGDGVVSLDS